MKRILVHCLLLCLCLFGRAQGDFRFADSTAVWNLGETYYFANTHETGIYVVQKDTTINGLDYQKITPPAFGIFASFIRRDSTGKVFVFDTTVLGTSLGDRLIYDFSLNEGDTFTLVKPSAPENDTVFLVVDSVSTTTLGHSRKTLFLKCISDPLCFEVTWIDGIGSLSSHFLSPLVFEFWPEGSAYELLCFTENGVTYNFASTCFVGVEDVRDYSTSITISPNPASTQLRVELAEPSLRLQSVQLYSVTGKEVMRSQSSGKTVTLDTQHLAPGVYFCRVLLGNGSETTRKVLIE